MDLSIEESNIRIPVLLMASEEDRGAIRSINDMIEDGIVGGSELTDRVLYHGQNDHGTDILTGPNGDDAREIIFGFLREHRL